MKESKAEFFQELDKVLLETYKERIKEFGEEANQPSTLLRLSEALKREEEYDEKVRSRKST